MESFENLNLTKQLFNALEDLDIHKPTPIQTQSFSVILSGKDMLGIAQTGTGKSFAYMLPILRNLKYSKQNNPRVLILVPTRELVIQVAEQTVSLAKYMNVRVVGVYGGVNINTQRYKFDKGCDVLVATPGRLYDLVLNRSVLLKDIKQLVIDEVDVMLDLGFRYQLTGIFDLLQKKRQNIMFSATMTSDIDALIDDFFVFPEKISIALSGTPLENIEQESFPVKNFYTKINLLKHLIQNREDFEKVLVFVSGKKKADLVFETLEEEFGDETAIIHSNKSQNYRIRSLKQFEEGKNRILITTDVMARGIDIEKISHVINFDTPDYPENYMHRIGRTGRAKEKGNTILFFTEKEEKAKKAIENLMSFTIPELEFPKEVKRSSELIAEERPKLTEVKNPKHKKIIEESGAAFHEKKDKNKKTNQGGSYLRKKKKYKRPKTKGDKNYNRRHKKK